MTIELLRCPRCGEADALEIDAALNSLSRRDNETQICNQCGDEEGFIDAGMRAVDEKEYKFVRTLLARNLSKMDYLKDKVDEQREIILDYEDQLEW